MSNMDVDVDVGDVGLDADMGEGNIILVSKDEQKFEVSRAAAGISKLITTALESDASGEEIPMPGVRGDMLELVVEYMEHHKGTEAPLPQKPLVSKDMKVVCKDEFDADFINKVGTNVEDLHYLTITANYMNINGLLNLCAAKIASIAKDETPERIAELLNPKTASIAKD